MADGFKRFFPAFLDLERRLAVVIGEGPALEKRVRQLLRYRADVTVVTPSPSEDLLQAEADGRLVVEQREYVRGDLSGAFLVMCVTDDVEIRKAVFDEADSKGIIVNVAGASEHSNFILPSVINRDPLQIAISTGGLAPELAKMLRREVESAIGDEWAPWIALLAETRALAFERVEDPQARERVMLAAASDWTRERLSLGMPLSAEQLLEEALAPESEVAETDADESAEQDEGVE